MIQRASKLNAISRCVDIKAFSPLRISQEARECLDNLHITPKAVVGLVQQPRHGNALRRRHLKRQENSNSIFPTGSIDEDPVYDGAAIVSTMGESGSSIAFRWPTLTSASIEPVPTEVDQSLAIWNAPVWAGQTSQIKQKGDTKGQYGMTVECYTTTFLGRQRPHLTASYITKNIQAICKTLSETLAQKVKDASDSSSWIVEATLDGGIAWFELPQQVVNSVDDVSQWTSDVCNAALPLFTKNTQYQDRNSHCVVENPPSSVSAPLGSINFPTASSVPTGTGFEGGLVHLTDNNGPPYFESQDSCQGCIGQIGLKANEYDLPDIFPSGSVTSSMGKPTPVPSPHVVLGMGGNMEFDVDAQDVVKVTSDGDMSKEEQDEANTEVEEAEDLDDEDEDEDECDPDGDGSSSLPPLPDPSADPASKLRKKRV
ncbi:MAG: hypothetical protein Q9227_003825 [Pyrenula ochraceoflavens]